MSTDKYDRQLRLWGAEGQKRLASSHVLLLHASAVGAETLKNLVLPGVKQFTIVDDQSVSYADVTNNFFVDEDDVGNYRAEVVTKLLLEMNSDVSGNARVADPRAIVQSEPEYFDQFNLIIASQVDDEATTRQLGRLCLQKNIPLIMVNVTGFLGYYRLQVAQHAVLDTKPDPPIQELRLSRPFPALEEFANSFKLTELSTIDHAHVPFVVLLLQAISKWKSSHDGQLPSTFDTKAEFRQMVKSMAWGPEGHEVNFTEAVDNAFKAYAPPIIPSEVEDVLSRAKSMTLTAQTDAFWILATAVATFVDQNDGMLPVTGVVPDMTASTDGYIALQRVYKMKAEEDATKVHILLLDLCQRLSIPCHISMDETRDFCSNCYNLAIIQTRSIEEELDCVDLSDFDEEDEDSTQSPLIWYLLLRAASSFTEQFQRDPGSSEESATQEQLWLVDKAQSIATNGSGAGASKLATWVTRAHAMEVVRSCEAELHTVASLMGGVASQEAIKVITRQFLPLDHTYVFNGVNGTAGTYKL